MGKKKEGRIAQACRLHKEGLTAKEIAAKMKISVWVARAYVWRGENSEKYANLLQRYRLKKKSKQSSSKPEANQSENSTEKKA